MGLGTEGWGKGDGDEGGEWRKESWLGWGEWGEE